MVSSKESEIFKRLKDLGLKTVLGHTPFPKPFYCDLSRVRAVYLGCDPSNSKNKRFTHVFALPNGVEHGFGQFVRSHRANLEMIGLTWETVYAQNLCRNYFSKETSKNSNEWKIAATRVWIDKLKNELRILRNDIPVLLTAEILYQVLLKPGLAPMRAIQFYTSDRKADIPIPAEFNLLERPLIPLYRHPKYDLSKWPGYVKKIKECLSTKGNLDHA